MRVSTLTATTLAPYAVVVLGDVALTDAQVTALTSWVDAGGNLVAMRPDSRLYGLAGITAQAGTVTDGYLGVNAAVEPGAGITTDTMQFHGTANRYSLNGATAVATLYSNATTSTGLPAVTLRSVGSNGGQVATFAFDLARSVIATRQGNVAWAGQDRDGATPNRSNDLFFGGATTDWVNLAKAAHPAGRRAAAAARQPRDRHRARPVPACRGSGTSRAPTRRSSWPPATTTAQEARPGVSAPMRRPVPAVARWRGGSARASRRTSTRAPR